MRLFTAALLINILLLALAWVKLKPNTSFVTKGYSQNNERYEEIAEWLADELRRTADPATGTIPEGIYDAEFEQALNTPKRNGFGKNNVANTYTFAGPSNLGGRTRAIAFDGRNPNIILAGGVSGGVFRTTNGGLSWVKVSANNQLHNVTSIVQDPRSGQQDTWYYATGEALGNSASAQGAFYLGNGIYKSTDNGVTWTRLANSNTGNREDFDNCNDLISRLTVNPVNGHIYAATLAQIIRSTDGGTTWTSVLGVACGTSTDLTDIVCTNAGVLYAAFSGSLASTIDGIWTSTSGNSGTWTRIANSALVTGWDVRGNYGRIVLALAPSNQNILYALYHNNRTNSNCTAPLPEADLFRYNLATGVWLDLSANLPNEPGCSVGNDPFAVQGGYDLAIAVKPDDPNFLVIGGTNIYRSTDAFTTTANTTRIGGYANANVYSLYPNSHPDIHTLVYKPGSNDTLWVGDDGGVQKAFVTSGSVTWTDMSNNYRTYQYYYTAIDPTSGSARYIGGAQDNGTTYNNASSTASMTRVFSGDGCSVGISASNTNHYVSFQRGNVFRRASSAIPDVGTAISPAANTGSFVTLFHLDPDNTEHLYFASSNQLYRTITASTATTGSGWTTMTGCGTAVGASAQISCFATSRGNYSASTSSLFIGTFQSGVKPKVLRLDNPANAAATATPVDITPTAAGWPTGGYVSWISVNPRNDDTVMVVLSNYNVSSIWWTGNANSATPVWQQVEANISIMSVRSCAIVARTTGIEYYVGTHVGLYSTTTINGSSTVWSQEGSAAGSLEFSIVSSMALRSVDNNLIIGTHGNGMWLTQIPNPLPVEWVNFSASRSGKSVQLSWATSKEINNKGFDVERSVTGETWTHIGFVKGQGNADNLNSYSYIDREAFQDAGGVQRLYYRLKQVDFNGLFEYSGIRVVNRQEPDVPVWTLFPSPARSYITVESDGLMHTRGYTYRLVQVAGLEAVTGNLNNQGKGTIINVTDLPAGLYVVCIYNDNREVVFTQKVVVAD